MAPITTAPAGRPEVTCAPETPPRRPIASKVKYRSPKAPESMAGVPTGSDARPANWLIPGVKTPRPSTLITTCVAVFDGVDTVRKPWKVSVWPAKLTVRPGTIVSSARWT